MASKPLLARFFAGATRPKVGLAERLDVIVSVEQSQLALWLPVAFGAGIFLWFWSTADAVRFGIGLLLLAVAAFAWLMGAQERLAARALLLASLTILAGLTAMAWRADRVSAPVLERPTVTGFAANVVRVEAQPAQKRLRLLLAPIARSDLPQRVRLSLANEDPRVGRIGRGDVLRVRARLMPPPRALLPGGYDYAQRAWFDGIGAVGSIIGTPQRAASAADRIELRTALAGHIQGRIAGSAGGIAAALATGDRGAISLADEEAMRRSGLTHLLSISGLHVTAAVGGSWWLIVRAIALFPAFALRIPLMLVGAAGGALTGLGYTLLTGSEVPTIRSLIAALLVVVALALGREALTLRLVAAGAMFVLLLWPETLAGPSFQMSFAAVTAIVAVHSSRRIGGWFARREEGKVRAVVRQLGSLLATGIAVELALIPIGLWHFHKAGAYGALANIIAIPLTTFIIMPFEALALVADTLGMGAPLWWVTEQAIATLLALAHWVAAAPGAVASLPVMPTSAFALSMAGFLWLCLWQRSHRLLGVIPMAVALLWTATQPAPDLLITSDGRHVAARLSDGSYALLRGRVGDYVRDQLIEATGSSLPMRPLEDAANVECNRDFCRWRQAGARRSITILAARSRDRSAWQPLIDACAAADIVIADRRLPRACAPRWLRLDRAVLAQSGGVRIFIDAARVDYAQRHDAGKPWVTPPRPAPPPNAQPRDGGAAQAAATLSAEQ